MVLLFFCYFSSFNCTYVASNKAFIKRIKNKRYYYGLVLPAALLCSFLAVSLVLIITLYVVTVPVNNSIETTSEGVTSIYNGAVLSVVCWPTRLAGSIPDILSPSLMLWKMHWSAWKHHQLTLG